MWRNLVGPMPLVTAEYDSPEWREQMRAQAVWWIRERHEKCAGCSKLRGPAEWNGRCTFCGTYVCSMTCFYDHTRECPFRPRQEDTSDSRAASSMSFRNVMEEQEEQDQIGLRERDQLYQAYHDEVLGLRMDPPPAPKPRQEMLVAGRGGIKAPPSWRGNRSQETLHAIRSIEPAPNLAGEPRIVAMLRDSHERMNDARRMYGTPMDVLGLDPGKQGRLPTKPPPSEEQVRAFHRSLDEQRQIEGARVLDAADRRLARRRHER